MRVALVYDRVNKWGGAERVLLVLHEMFPKAPLYTSVYNPQSAPWAEVFPKIQTSFLQKLLLARKNHELLAPLMPMAFESFNFDEYDLVISVTSEAAKGIKLKPHTTHLCYCLTPTRYLWSHYEEYFKRKTLRYLSKPAVSYLRAWDKQAAKRPDVMVAISSAVQGRIKDYYNRDSEVISPPVSFQVSDIEPSDAEDYFLVVSRLVPYKRIDLVIDAFNELGLPLVIVGMGREERKLKAKARRNIKFTGQLTDKQLADYYKRTAGLIFPQEEDFGLVAVEAQSFGAPVIAYKSGGALDTVTQETGIFFDKQEKESLIKAIKRLKRTKFDRKKIIKNASRFSKGRFKKDFLKLVKDAKR